MPEWSGTWTLLGSIIVALLTGGGIGAWIKARGDVKKGIAEQELAEDNSESDRWKLLINTQTEVLLEPLRLELNELRARFTALELELAASRRKYWVAIPHIRILRSVIEKHGVEVPPLPPQIADDV